MPKMGNKRHRVSLQQRTETVDSHGDVTLSYTTLATVWASIEGMTARERFADDQVRADATHKVRIMYASAYEALNPADRIVYGSRTFEIVEGPTDMTGLRVELEFVVREIL